jgi:hypothetical protein
MENNWPKQKEVTRAFGRIELGQDGLPTPRWELSNLTTIATPYPLRLSWDLETTVRRIRCHRGVAADLTAILDEIFHAYKSDLEEIRAARMDLYGGAYNFRRSRGGPSLSMHAYGIAIDLDPEKNALGVKWEADKAMVPELVIDIFATHGWSWGGLWKELPEAGHFQATKR